jgi:hypothetical protein
MSVLLLCSANELMIYIHTGFATSVLWTWDRRRYAWCLSSSGPQDLRQMMMFLMSSLPEIYITSELNLKGLSLEFFGILFLAWLDISGLRWEPLTVSIFLWCSSKFELNYPNSQWLTWKPHRYTSFFRAFQQNCSLVLNYLDHQRATYWQGYFTGNISDML